MGGGPVEEGYMGAERGGAGRGRPRALASFSADGAGGARGGGAWPGPRLLPALRPPSWRRPSRGPAPPRRLPATFWRVSPLQGPGHQAGRRAGAGVLQLVRLDPHPLGGGGNAREPGRGAEMQSPRRDAFLSPRRRIFPDTQLCPLHPRLFWAPLHWRRSESTGRGRAAYGGGTTPIPAGSPLAVAGCIQR